MRRLINANVAVVMCWFCAACSNQQVYEASQENRRFDCQKLPPGQVEECMARYDKPYEQYERERQEVLDD